MTACHAHNLRTPATETVLTYGVRQHPKQTPALRGVACQLEVHHRGQAVGRDQPVRFFSQIVMREVAGVHLPHESQGFAEIACVGTRGAVQGQTFDPFASQLHGVAVDQARNAWQAGEQRQGAAFATQQMTGERCRPPWRAARIAQHVREAPVVATLDATEQVGLQDAHGKINIFGSGASSRHSTAALTSANSSMTEPASTNAFQRIIGRTTSVSGMRLRQP